MWNQKTPYQSGSDIADTLYVGKGNEVIDGKGGSDVLVTNTIYTNSGLRFDSIKGSWMLNSVQLLNIESIKFGDVQLELSDVRLTQPTQHVSTNGADNMVGNDFGYILNGGSGDDRLTGNGGDETLYGGKGIDVAIYRGSRSDYVVERNGTTGRYTVQDLNTNRDGTDTLVSIERLLFADGEFAIDDLATLKPGSEPPPPPPPPSQHNNFMMWTHLAVMPMVIFDVQEDFATTASVALHSADAPAMVGFDGQEVAVSLGMVGVSSADLRLYTWDGFSL